MSARGVILRRVAILIAILLAIPAFLLLGFVAWNWAALSTFPAMPSSYEAKELCSCLWVEGRKPEDCDRFVRQDVVPTQGRVTDFEARTVTAKALWTESRARWASQREGCILE